VSWADPAGGATLRFLPVTYRGSGRQPLQARARGGGEQRGATTAGHYRATTVLVRELRCGGAATAVCGRAGPRHPCHTQHQPPLVSPRCRPLGGVRELLGRRETVELPPSRGQVSGVAGVSRVHTPSLVPHLSGATCVLTPSAREGGESATFRTPIVQLAHLLASATTSPSTWIGQCPSGAPINIQRHAAGGIVSAGRWSIHHTSVTCVGCATAFIDATRNMLRMGARACLKPRYHASGCVEHIRDQGVDGLALWGEGAEMRIERTRDSDGEGGHDVEHADTGRLRRCDAATKMRTAAAAELAGF
jgi:hypothetical protein